jgi:glycolate oxidase
MCCFLSTPTPRLCGEVPGPYREHPLEAAGIAERF